MSTLEERDRRALLAVQDLTVSFGAVRAVNRVGFSVGPSEIVGLIGPNGAGKTTAFNAITGFIRPQEGSVRLDGNELVGRQPHQIANAGLARTFQRLSVFRHLTVRENLAAALGHRRSVGLLRQVVASPRARLAHRETEQELERLAQAMNLEALLDVPAGALSYGSQRLLAVALVLARRPHVLLLDEPAAGLNPRETLRLRAVIRDACERGTSVLLVEHDLRLVMKTCHWVVILAGGAKLAEGPPEQVQNDPAVIEAYIGARR